MQNQTMYKNTWNILKWWFVYWAAKQGSCVTFQYHDLLLRNIDRLKEILALVTVSRILS